MRWFGKSWNAPINETCEHTTLPLRTTCSYCYRLIRGDSQGLEIPGVDEAGAPFTAFYHLPCFLRSMGISNEPITIG